jgi:hypothetical protein
MLTGHLDQVEHSFIAGWAADSGAPEAAQDLIVYVNGQRIATVQCDRPRSDLRSLGNLGQGNHGFRYDFSPSLARDLDARVSVRFAANGEVLPAGDALLIGQRAANQLTPILVTAPGRSGTTRLMSRLCHSRQVIGAEIHPFEVRLLAYYAAAYHVLISPADFVRSMHPDYLEGTGYQVGFNPFSHGSYATVFQEPRRSSELFCGYASAELLSAFRRIVMEYYLRLRDDQGKPGARYFVEKTNNLDRRSREFPRVLFGKAKEIVLIRDPRDLYCSHMAYFNAGSDAAMNAVAGASAELIRIASAAGDDTIFVNYRDLVTADDETMFRLSQFLDVEIGQQSDDERLQKAFAIHATSKSPEASLGRWRHELDADTVGTIVRHCADYFRLFGDDDCATELHPKAPER